jgi:hypothetical protein
VSQQSLHAAFSLRHQLFKPSQYLGRENLG